MAEIDDPRASDEELWEGVEQGAQQDRRRIAILLSVIALAGFVVVGLGWLALGSDGPESPPSTGSIPATMRAPVVGFDVGDAVRLGADTRTQPGVIIVPECFGPVTRISLVAADLRSTSWEVIATDADWLPRVDRIDIGSVPEGFSAVVALADVPNAGIVVVNGPDHLGLLLLDGVESSEAPGSC